MLTALCILLGIAGLVFLVLVACWVVLVLSVRDF